MSSGDDRVLIRSANGTIANKMESDGSYIASFARSLWVTGVSVLLILVVFLEQLPKNSPHSRRRRRMGDRVRIVDKNCHSMAHIRYPFECATK